MSRNDVLYLVADVFLYKALIVRISSAPYLHQKLARHENAWAARTDEQAFGSFIHDEAIDRGRYPKYSQSF